MRRYCQLAGGAEAYCVATRTVCYHYYAHSYDIDEISANKKSATHWHSKVGVGPCAKIPKGPLVPLTGFVSLQSEQAIPIFWQFLGRPNRPKVCHTSKSQIFPVISDETNYRRLVYTLFKNFFLNKQNG